MRRTLIVLTLAALIMGACDDAGNSGADDTGELEVLYFVRISAEDDDPNEPEFELRAARRGNDDPRLVVALPAIRDDFGISPDGNFAALPTDYTDDPELLLIELSSGTVTPLIDSTGGNGAVELGPDGAIALCRENGDFFVGNIDDIGGMRMLMPGAGSASGCPSVEWARDGGLLFKAPIPLAAPEFGDDYAFYILNGSLEQTKVIPLPEKHQPRSRQTGPVSITLSADGGKLAYIAGPFGEQSIHVLDLASGAISEASSGYELRFSPTDADLIAVRDLDEDSLIVRRGTEEVARLPQDEDFAFAWCPESSWIAIGTVVSVSLWNWRSGEVAVLARSDFPNGPLLGDDVACVNA